MTAPLTALLLLLTTTTAAHAETPPGLAGPAQGFGVGLVVGDPSGPTYLQAAAGWNFGDDTLSLNGDWLWTFTSLSIPDEPDHAFPIYVGLGGRLRLGTDKILKEGRANSVGFRVPVGISYTPRPVGVDVYVEIAPTLVLLPETLVDVTFAFGARIYPFRKVVKIRM
jgi:hypothetical protein